jgi:SHS2 domain-containing protein
MNRPAGHKQKGLGWEHFAHDADIGICGYGPTLERAFEQAALGLTAVITEAEVGATETVAIHCEDVDYEYLFVDWLNALVYEMAVRQLVFSRFKVTIRDHTLDAEAVGEPLDVARHQPACEVKGATYTALSVEHDSAGWTACCVVDV